MNEQIGFAGRYRHPSHILEKSRKRRRHMRRQYIRKILTRRSCQNIVSRTIKRDPETDLDLCITIYDDGSQHVEIIRCNFMGDSRAFSRISRM